MSYWLDSITNFPVLRHDIHAEVVVIGAGITGASVSSWLSSKCKTVLLESEIVASKASGRNAGFLLTGTSEYYNRAVELYGHRRGKAVWKLTQENHTLLEKHILKNHIDCEYKRSGSYLVAFSKKELNDIDESIKLLNHDGFSYKRIGKREINELLSSRGFHGAAFNAFDGEINPVKLVRGLVRVANNKGVYVFENTPVKKIERKYNLFKIRTKHGTVTADYVVLATNAYTPLIHPYFRNMIKPVRGQVVVTNPCRKLFDGVFYANYGYEYWRQLPDGRILAGGFRETDPVKETGYKMITTRKIQNKLEGLLHRLSVKSKVAYRWSGTMAFTKDRLPIIGSIPNMKNFLVSVGYSGHGLGFGFIAGKMIGEEILYNKSSKIFSPVRSL
jgi:glycine/D-amino acid oxidase-like deaminating enzyme